MSNHTPGPWRVGALPPVKWRYILREDDLTEVAAVSEYDDKNMCYDDLQGEEAQANAHLIAAAPDLLEALRFAKSVIKSGEPWTEECERVIGGAIAKARGSEPS